MQKFDDRILKLHNLKILDTKDEEAFDEIVHMATEICRAPIGFINLLDINRQWFKSVKGIEFRETPLDVSICKHTIDSPMEYMFIRDLAEDARFVDNPFVIGPPNVRSYLGVCLTTEDGHRIGTLAAFDIVPREFTEREIFGLITLAKGTMRLIRDKTMKIEFQNQNRILKTINKNLESFNYFVAHDVKAPLRQMAAFSQLLLNRSDQSKFEEWELEFLTYIQNNSNKLMSLVDKLLEFAKNIQLDHTDFTYLDPTEILTNILQILNPIDHPVSFSVSEEIPNLFVSRIIFERIFQNLLSNAVKYRDTTKETCVINIGYSHEAQGHIFTVQDNGIGMDEERIANAFKLFNKDHSHEHSTGVGLCIVKELLQRIDGKIDIESKVGVGTLVRVVLP